MFLIIINCSNTLIGEHAWTKSNTTRLKNVQQSAKNYLCTILCHGQNLGEFLVLGVCIIPRDYCTHCKDSNYGMDDDTTYTIFWPWHRYQLHATMTRMTILPSDYWKLPITPKRLPNNTHWKENSWQWSKVLGSLYCHPWWCCWRCVGPTACSNEEVSPFRCFRHRLLTGWSPTEL